MKEEDSRMSNTFTMCHPTVSAECESECYSQSCSSSTRCGSVWWNEWDWQSASRWQGKRISPNRSTTYPNEWTLQLRVQFWPLHITEQNKSTSSPRATRRWPTRTTAMNPSLNQNSYGCILNIFKRSHTDYSLSPTYVGMKRRASR